jgi:hypothetical protein
MKTNMALFLNKHEAGKDLRKYNHFQNLDTETNRESHKNTDIAAYIHDNFHKMDESEMKYIVTKILDIDTIKEMLMTYDFDNYEYETVDMTINEFVSFALNMFKRYHKLCGDYLEDKDWVVHKCDSKKFDVGKNEVMFLNTVDKIDVDDVTEYLDKLVENLNKGVFNMDVTYEFVVKKKIVYVMIWGKMYDVGSDEDDDDVVGL